MPSSKKLQELIDRISHQRAKLLESISGLSDAQLNHKSAEDAWSISNVVHHVSRVDEANAKLTSKMLKRALTEQLPRDDSPDSSEIRALDEVFARMGAAKFQAPEFVAPHPHAPIEESLSTLKTSRERMLANVEQLDGFDLRVLTHPHPFAGPLNAYQWILMAGAHEARHAEQINRMKALPDFPK